MLASQQNIQKLSFSDIETWTFRSNLHLTVFLLITKNFICKQPSIFLLEKVHNPIDWWLRKPTEGEAWQANQMCLNNEKKFHDISIVCKDFGLRHKQQQLTREKWMKLNFCLRLLKHIKTIFLRLSKVASFFLSAEVKLLSCQISFLSSLFFLPPTCSPTKCLLELQKTDKNLLSKRKNSLCYEWMTVLSRWMSVLAQKERTSSNFLGEKKKRKTRGSFTRREREIHMSRCLSIFCRMFEQRYQIFCLRKVFLLWLKVDEKWRVRRGEEKLSEIKFCDF